MFELEGIALQCARSLFDAGAVEILFLDGAGRLQAAGRDMDLDPGQWLIARWPAATWTTGELVALQLATETTP